MATDPAIYEPLDESKAEIRVLELQPGQESEPIRCFLRTISLDSDPKPQYHALSYVWGDPSITKPVFVNDHVFHTTVNLATALRYLRSKDEALVLWADAICINQADEIEKASQVAQMRSIYQLTSQLHVWLGEFTETWRQELDGAWKDFDFEALPKQGFVPCSGCVLSPDELNWMRSNLPETVRNGHEWTGTIADGIYILECLAMDIHLYEMPFYEIQDLPNEGPTLAVSSEWHLATAMLHWILSRPWAKRVWVLQEVALSPPNAIVHVGNQQISALLFWTASQNFVHHLHKRCCLQWMPHWTTDVDEMAIINNMDDWEQSASFTMNDRRDGHGISDALVVSTSRLATDPRDYLYGILGIINPAALTTCIKVDYTLSLRDVSCQTTRLCILDQPRIWWPRAPIVGLEASDMPSWTLRLAFDQSPSTSVIGWPVRAGGDATAWENTVLNNDMTTSTLRLEATRITTIKSYSSSAGHDAISLADDNALALSFERLIRWADLAASCNAADLETAFLRAILTENGPPTYNPRDATIDYIPLEDAFLSQTRDWWHKFVQLWDLARETNGVAARINISFLDAAQHAEDEYIRDLFSSPVSMHLYNQVLQWMFFITEDDEFGMGPFSLEVGDEIFVARGVYMPLVLRRQEPQPGIEEATFKMVGACHLNGWMQGKALEGDREWEYISIIGSGVGFYSILILWPVGLTPGGHGLLRLRSHSGADRG